MVVILILTKDLFWPLFTLLMLIIIGLDTLTRLLDWFLMKPRRWSSAIWLPLIGDLVMMILFVVFNHLMSHFTVILFGWWSLLNALSRLLGYFVARRDHLRFRRWLLLDGVITLIFSFMLIFSQAMRSALFEVYIGSYLIFYGAMQLISAINALSDHRLASYIHLPVPVFLATVLPSSVVRIVGEMVRLDPREVATHVDPTMDEHEVSVYFYMENKSFNRFGHVDIGYMGKSYSYGNHDPFNRQKYLLYGDGVLIRADEASFVGYQLEARGHVIARFRIRLNDTQLTKFKEALNKLLARTVPFAFPYDEDPQASYYLTRLHRATKDMSLFKFSSGMFRTYYILTTNCVLLVDTLLRKSGINMFNISGVITPGTYFDLLNDLYLTPESPVIQRIYYHKRP